jgi:uncharacterized protein (DUF885 family)
LDSYYGKYSSAVAGFSNSDLSETEQMSKAVLEWELDLAKAKLQAGIEKGYVLPKSLIMKVAPQLRAMTGTSPEEHLFYGPIKQLPDSFSPSEKQQITAQFMETDYMAAGRDSSGINDVPNGEAFYQHQIKLYTTTTMSADEIHQLGLSEVARILSEMEKAKLQFGYKGDRKSFFNHVRNNKELMPFTEPQEVIDYFGALHERMEPQLEQLFEMKPKTAFEVRRTEQFRENSASAEYNIGSLDGTRPGIFYTPIPNAAEYNIYDAGSLFLHEAMPGHHYQISLTQENTELPEFRKVLWYSGYGEGWALYTGSLGKELSLYIDPYQYFGMLSAEMHRAIRLVVDTGLHSKAWTRRVGLSNRLFNIR